MLDAIKFYQKIASRYSGQNCRFWPSCSEYTFLAIEKYGLIKGIFKGTVRILKCFPWHSGGVDLP